jgi:hypothetical protein
MAVKKPVILITIDWFFTGNGFWWTGAFHRQYDRTSRW